MTVPRSQAPPWERTAAKRPLRRPPGSVTSPRDIPPRSPSFEAAGFQAGTWETGKRHDRCASWTDEFQNERLPSAPSGTYVLAGITPYSYHGRHVDDMKDTHFR